MNEIVISSFNELIDRLFANSWDAEIKRHRPPYVYQGLDDSSYQLRTSLIRLGGNYVAVERHLLRNFRKYAHRKAVQHDSIWNWLSLAEHHGLPTRLLDWTYSPLIAAHFATCNVEKFNLDGVIWCVDFIKTHKLLPSPLSSLLESEGTLSFTVEMLDKTARSLGEFDTLSSEDFVVFFDPPSLDQRIINQYALFSVISNPQTLLDDWLDTHSNLCHKIIIPRSLKWEIRDKIDKTNITERVLFPGLDGLACWLKRYYTPHDVK